MLIVENTLLGKSKSKRKTKQKTQTFGMRRQDNQNKKVRATARE